MPVETEASEVETAIHKAFEEMVISAKRLRAGHDPVAANALQMAAANLMVSHNCLYA